MVQKRERSDPITQAMQQVLQAEQHAEQELAEIQVRTNEIVNGARATARAIRKRANDRVRRLQAANTDKINTELSELRQRTETAAHSEHTAIDDRLLSEAVARLADKLTGAEHESET